jgi:protoporphyrinogen oxidase
VTSPSKVAVVVGAGPAGLTAAYELLQRSDVVPIVIEADSQVGGISKTIVYRGNRMDLGGHRFFSKSDWVMKWWQAMLPVAHESPTEHRTPRQSVTTLAYHGERLAFTPESHPGSADERVLLVRRRLSRIFYRRRFFDYPLKLNATTLRNLGLAYSTAVGLSYLWARLAPRFPEVTLEDFLFNRFGERLYRTFFKDYTEKVWGVPCSQISAEWGAQRIKGLSVSKAIGHALTRPLRARGDTHQKGIETSLIERFLYPRLGPGQMWETVAERVTLAGGEIHLQQRVVGIVREGQRVIAADVLDVRSGTVRRVACDYLISTMPVKELCGLLSPEDSEVARVAAALPYRDFITAGLLVRRMLHTGAKDRAQPTDVSHVGGVQSTGIPPDNWIYVQESDVKLGRLQIFNNWSPALVADPATIWLGLEYFCAQGDELWSTPDARFVDFAAGELAKIGLIERADVLDGTVVRVPKAYPAYFGEYRSIGHVRAFLDRFANLFPIGRNGMHRYNNQDHSMLAAKAAVDAIIAGDSDKRALWAVNVEDEYHEEARRADLDQRAA